ncbi:hypothetical protein BCE02nite_39510 [Brevibacillus centrosporus]|uniref:Uncharacterized protein n=1 Tax=Brevibacillus centrosporus TaxID=54910 RepID=A0A1I3ZMX3_9BACL|nr:hypothetical protein BCE02nite_39510 [Brevibacillus centrosporus]SFK45395.1 hypothetical protein SAMN05518846_113166 [Brevibacillus centrosporus]
MGKVPHAPVIRQVKRDQDTPPCCDPFVRPSILEGFFIFSGRRPVVVLQAAKLINLAFDKRSHNILYIKVEDPVNIVLDLVYKGKQRGYGEKIV